MSGKTGGISSALLDAINGELGQMQGLPLEQRLSIIDRALKLEALKLKVDDGEEGSAFRMGDTDE